MTATAYELFAGRTQTIDAYPMTGQVEWIIRGAVDEAEVETAALAEVPGSIVMAGITVPRKSLEISERLAPTTWKLRATYQQVEPNSPTLLENTFTFDTGGATQHITQSPFGTATRYGPKSPDLGGAIGVDDQSVAGCDIIVPAYEWSEQFWFSDAVVDLTYKLNLASWTGCVNNATFRGFAAGSVLFKGVSGSKRGNGMWELTFKFAFSENRTGLTVGAITAINKKGWQYMWVRYEPDVQSNLIVQKAVGVYIEDVYSEADFSVLAIGS
jgi:hypothetical protein